MDSSESSNPDTSPKKSPFDDLSKDELVHKCKGLLAIAQKAKQAKLELQVENDGLKAHLEQFGLDKKNNLENINTLQELVDSLTEQKLNYITEYDLAQNKIKTLNTKCDNYEEDIKRYKADNIVKDNVITNINQKISDLDTEITSLRRQNNRLLEENEQLLSQLTEFEASAAQFNNIGMEQREQLKVLEESVQTADDYKKQIEELNNQIKSLESKVDSNNNLEAKLNEANQLYETEKAKKEKANIKLRSYKDKILKCAACINQLKNSRFILTKTVKEYSENIPKWQNDILKASKILDSQIKELHNENVSLKEKMTELEKQLAHTKEKSNDQNSSQIDVVSHENSHLRRQLHILQNELMAKCSVGSQLERNYEELKVKYKNIIEKQLPSYEEETKLLKERLDESIQRFNEVSLKYNELLEFTENLKQENQALNERVNNSVQSNEDLEKHNLQIKALESEKFMLVKEKLNARDNVLELENLNKILTEQLNKLKTELKEVKCDNNLLSREKATLQNNYKAEKDSEVNILKCNLMAQQEQFNLLKKEHDDLLDLNGLLKEEVETLKLSLEQPKDDNLSDLNVSLQADIVKLETKLAAYKQENAILLVDIKESRNRSKECDAIMTEYEEAKSKLLSYKSENTELLNEMKEINQELKERGETISKLEKVIAEKERDDMTVEKVELYKKIEGLENNLRRVEQMKNKTNDDASQASLEMEIALKNLSIKDATIAALKDEIEKLKQQTASSSADLPNEDMSTSTISKAEEHSRMKDLDETFEEKYTKLRIFALKLKKKLNETNAQLKQTESDKAKLEKLLNETKVAAQGHDEVDSAVPAPMDDTNLEAKVKALTEELEAVKISSAEYDKLKAELSCKNQQLVSEIEAHKVTKDNLEKAWRDVKKKNVLSLEMEDYERSMKELTAKMEESKKKIVQMESTIDAQEGTITAMKTQIKLLEEQIKTDERQNRIVKEELQHAIEESREKDNVLHAKNNIITKLEQELDNEKRKNEESDLELTTVLSDKEKIIMALGEDKTELNNKVKRLEFKNSELNEKLRIINIELADLKTEYTSYKVRAQAVLRQNQTVDHSQEEQLKEEAAALRAQIQSLTAKLTSAEEKISEKTAEVESGKRKLAEATTEAQRGQQRTARLQADLARLALQLEAERSQHNNQVSTITQCYKSQISDLEAKLVKETENLKAQLSAAQESSKRTVTSLADANRNQYTLPVIPKDEGSDGEMDINVSMIPREEGEGSESAPSPPPSKPYLSRGRSPVPLERLLEEGVPEDEALDASLGLTPEQELPDLKRRLQAQQHRVKHVTVLLAESERECARLTQLSELLKAELRRARPADTQHNTQYMKNVTLKFLTLPPGDERSRLVPVLQKILTLTQEETHTMQAVAKGLDPNPSKGWGSYLPWPGGK